jgi:Na+/melibiose symporter-like transporter
VLGGALVAASGPHLAYWINAATFALSAAFVLAIPARRLQSDRPIGRGHWADLREGFDTVLGSRPLTAVLVSWSVFAIALGMVNVAEIFLARRTLHGGALAFGLLWAGSGIGQIAGGLNAQRLAGRFGTHWLYPRALLVAALGIAIAAAAPDVPVAIAGMLVSGIGNGVGIVLNITLVQRAAPDAVRGRALTAIMSANALVLLFAFLGAGPLTNAEGARVAFAIGAGALVAAAAAASAVLPREEQT